MLLYEVEVKARFAVYANDREEAKRLAAAIAARLPIDGFDMTARRSLIDIDRGYSQSESGRMIFDRDCR